MPSLNRDGVALFYEETGSGDPSLLFVHGWCCDRSYFAPQFEHFGRSHRVVAVDLRGHGQSGKPEQDYTIAGFAGDLAWLCAELNLANPVVIGHSLGGTIAARLAADPPELPAALVLLDAAMLLREPVRQGMQSLPAQLWTPAYREVAGAFVANLLILPIDDQDLKERTVAGMASAPLDIRPDRRSGAFPPTPGAGAGQRDD